MANVIQVKRNLFTATGNPTALAYGELGWNNNNGGGGRLYVGSQRDNATPPVITEECLNKSVVGTTNEITVAEANTLFTVGLPDDVTIAGDLSVTGDVTVNDVSCVDISADDITCDQLTTTGNVVLGNATSDTVTIAGNLTVNGTTTTINSTTVAIDDKTFVIADGQSAANCDASGYFISDVASIIYEHTGTKLQARIGASLGAFQASSFIGPITGSVTGNADTATTLATARNIGGVSFNGSANINLPGVNAAGNQNTTGEAATVASAFVIDGGTF